MSNAQKAPYALVIGGANIDFVGLPHQPLIWHDSNPGQVKTSLGGVGRNVAENLARLGVATKLLSAVGDDSYGMLLMDKTQQAGVDMSAMFCFDEKRTSTYFSVMNGNDMAVAIADMEIIDAVTPIQLMIHAELINDAILVILDTNLPIKTLSFLLIEFPQTRFLVDPVSVAKTTKIKPLLAHIDTLKPNRLETEVLTGITINTINDAQQAIDRLIEQGLKHVFISLGPDGIIYGDTTGEYNHCTALPTTVNNAAGAGDSMMAGIAYGLINELSVSEILQFANATASLTLQSDSTITQHMSVNAVKQLLTKNN